MHVVKTPYKRELYAQERKYTGLHYHPSTKKRNFQRTVVMAWNGCSETTGDPWRNQSTPYHLGTMLWNLKCEPTQSSWRRRKNYRDYPVTYSTRSKRWSHNTRMCFVRMDSAGILVDSNSRLTRLTIHPFAENHPCMDLMSLGQCEN